MGKRIGYGMIKEISGKSKEATQKYNLHFLGIMHVLHWNGENRIVCIKLIIFVYH